MLYLYMMGEVEIEIPKPPEQLFKEFMEKLVKLSPDNHNIITAAGMTRELSQWDIDKWSRAITDYRWEFSVPFFNCFQLKVFVSKGLFL